MVVKYKSSRERIINIIEKKILPLFFDDPYLELSYNKFINEIILETGAKQNLVEEIFDIYFKNNIFMEQRLILLHPEKIKEFGEKKLENFKEIEKEIKGVGLE